MTTKILQLNFFDGSIVNEDLALCWIIEALKQIDEGGFAAAAFANECDALSADDLEIDVTEDPGVAIAKGNIFVANLFPVLREKTHTATLVDFAPIIEDLKNSLCRDNGLLNADVALLQFFDGL